MKMIHMRSFNEFEKRNIEYLVNLNVDFTQVQVTATGLHKSILDATAPMRTYLREHRIHDYGLQKKGQDFKVSKPTVIHTGIKAIETRTSFYRPETKEGDPRLWIYKLKDFSEPNDIYAIIAQSPNQLHVVDLTKIDIQKFCETSEVNPLQELVFGLSEIRDSISIELLHKLFKFRNEWIDTYLSADSAIGRKIESLLGISMNASQLPDYKGIELKSFRDARPNIKKNLFCKVPDWDISKLKSAAEIVEKYGYNSNGIKSYRNTLYSKYPNSQNLRLNVNYLDALLEIEEDEILGNDFKKISDVALWRLQTLHQQLLTKHHETFWIEVNSRKIENGKEQFMLNKIEHTRNPIVSQFDILLEQSLITVDLLLGRPKKDSLGLIKKGGDSVIFKIKKNATSLLFPESRIYNFLTTTLNSEQNLCMVTIQNRFSPRKMP